MLRLSILLPALLAAGCYEEPAEVELASTTGRASSGPDSPATIDAATSLGVSTDTSGDDSSGVAPGTGAASTTTDTGEASGGCVPAVFGDALFDNACFQ